MKIKRLKLTMLVEYEEFPIELKIDVQNPSSEQAKEFLTYHAKELLEESKRVHLDLKKYEKHVLSKS